MTARLARLWLLVVLAGACSAPGSTATAPTATPPEVVVPPQPSSGASPDLPSAAPADPASAPTGTPFTSSRYGYSLLVPEGWTVTETPGTGGLHPDEPGVDTFHGPDGRILSVVGEPVAAGTGLDAWSCAIGRHLEGEHATPVESTEVLMAAGQTTRLSRYHLHIDPYVIHYLNAELVHGQTGLTFSMESTSDDDAADEAVFRSILADLTLVSG